MRIARSFLVGVLLLFVACHSSPTEPAGGRKVGIIDAGGTLPMVIAAPAAVLLGKSFSVSISTFGDSCVIPAGADVVVDGLVATITPYDVAYVPPRGGACLLYLKPYPREVELRFLGTGTATIRVEGRSFYQSGLVTVTHSLVVSQ